MESVANFRSLLAEPGRRSTRCGREGLNKARPEQRGVLATRYLFETGGERAAGTAILGGQCPCLNVSSER